MSDDDVMTFDFGDGVSALDRLMRSIVMMTDGVIGKITGLGYPREEIFLKVHEDGLPLWVELNGETVFVIETTVEGTGRVSVKGKWLKEVRRRRRGILAIILGK